MKHVNHLFMPQQTIIAVIKLHNGMLTDEDKIQLLLKEFDRLNDSLVPRVGQNFKIPVIDE